MIKLFGYVLVRETEYTAAIDQTIALKAQLAIAEERIKEELTLKPPAAAKKRK